MLTFWVPSDILGTLAKDEFPLGGDRMILGPDLGGGSRPCVRHLPDHSIQTGIVRPLEDGKPINGPGEILETRYDPKIGDYEVRSVYILGRPSTQDAKPTSKGPPKVTSNEYRAGYDRIFGHQAVGEA